MINKLDKPVIIELNNISQEYLSLNKACKYLKISPNSKTLGLDKFITCYLYKEKKYFKNDDIKFLYDVKQKLDRTINLCPILGLKDPKGIKNFLEKKNIRFMPYKTHPFGSAHLYYKEDLDYIIEMYSEFKYEQKIQQSNLHKYSLKNRVENKIANKGSKIDFITQSTEISYDQLDNYFTEKESIKLLKNGDLNVVSFNNFLKSYHYNYNLYYKKSDVINLANKFKDIVSISYIAKELGYSKSYISNLVNNNIKLDLLRPGDHPYGKRTFIYKNDMQKIKEYLDYQYNLNLSDYISYKDTINLFGVATPAASINKFSSPIKYKNILYYKKEDILNLLNYLKNTVTLISLEKKYSKMIGECALRTLLLNNDIKLIYPEEHPFTFGILVYKVDLKKIDSLVKIRFKVYSTESRYEKFRILISKLSIKKSIRKTLNDFRNEFIYQRFRDSKDDSLHLSLYKVYKILLDLLSKNLYNYSTDDINRFISIVFNDDRYSNNVKNEFINFCNFCDKKYNSGIGKTYTLNTKQMIKQHRDTSAYSKDQLLKLFGLLYCSLDDREYLDKALNNKNYAMAWLYMYIHYTVFWRYKTILDIPIPNLKLIGFQSGKEFIEWCKDSSNTFTVEMGMKICDSVKIQIDSLVITAKKNNRPLVFEHGKLMSRGLGFLLALCEAHRQIVELDLEKIKLNEKSGFGATKDVNRLITSNIRNSDHFVGLFGDKYTSILGDTMFNNTKCSKAFNNYTLDYSDTNNNALGSQILSIMRSHVVNINGISNTTTTYETRLEDGTISEIESTLQEIGAFGFTKYTLLSICDSKFKSYNPLEKKLKSLNLSMSPMQIEAISKSVFIQQQDISNFINKMIINPNVAKNVLRELAYGNVAGKHNHSRCLLKALINANVETLDEFDENEHLGLFINSHSYTNCLLPDCDSCFTCPLLIGETYLLYELNEIICDCIKNMFSIKNSFECSIQSSLLFNSYLPILYAAQDVLGEDIVYTYMDIEYISTSLELLENEGKILLDFI